MFADVKRRLRRSPLNWGLILSENMKSIAKISKFDSNETGKTR